MKRQSVGIIGYGRFGQFWAGVLRPFHEVWVTDAVAQETPNYLPLPELCRRADALFLCVPINQVAEVVAQVRPYLKPGTTVFDTCSVKVYPAEALASGLGAVEGVNLIATHPMFGPDSAARGVSGLPMAIWPIAGDADVYGDWFSFFNDLGIQMVEVSPEEHDRLAAYSQGVAHYVGRVLGELDLHSTPIDTQGFKVLRSLTEQTCNDSWELFHDLQNRNPYTQAMRLQLETAFDTVYEMLLPERVSPEAAVVGIQGGKGSFNEEACLYYCASQAEMPAFRIAYLYTTENVLRALHKGEVDFGVFAIQNARGGVVLETIQALSRYSCEIIAYFEIVINHCILHHPEVAFEAVDTLISHPQALAQCAQELAKRYPRLELASGEGDLIDQAHCAQNIAAGKLPRTTAVLASKVCADLYGLSIHDEGLQDLGEANLTTFVWVRRRRNFHGAASRNRESRIED